MKNLFWLLSLLVMTSLFALPVKAQVTIGTNEPSYSFSILELIAKNKEGGLRLPQLTTADRITLTNEKLATPADKEAAKGLVIYNTTTNCLEFWDGSVWISLCDDISSSFTQSNPASVSTCRSSITLDPGPATGATGAITYLWQQSSDGINWSDASKVEGSNTEQSYKTPVLPYNMYYRRQATAALSADADLLTASISPPYLFLPAASYRTYNDATVRGTSSNGYYWSSSISGIYAYSLQFSNIGLQYNGSLRGNGMSVRCVKE